MYLHVITMQDLLSQGNKLSAGFGKSSFRIILSNQKLARALTILREQSHVMLHSNFGDEHRGLCPVLEAGFRHQLVVFPPTVLHLGRS